MKGDYSLCKHYSFIGSRQYGSFAEYVVVPEANAVLFGDDVSFEQGAFFEPATVALHGLMRVDYRGGGSVAIHLDHGSSYELAMQALRVGYTSIMIDGSHESFEENVSVTKAVVDA